MVDALKVTEKTHHWVTTHRFIHESRELDQISLPALCVLENLWWHSSKDGLVTVRSQAYDILEPHWERHLSWSHIGYEADRSLRQVRVCADSCSWCGESAFSALIEMSLKEIFSHTHPSWLFLLTLRCKGRFLPLPLGLSRLGEVIWALLLNSTPFHPLLNHHRQVLICLNFGGMSPKAPLRHRQPSTTEMAAVPKLNNYSRFSFPNVIANAIVVAKVFYRVGEAVPFFPFSYICIQRSARVQISRDNYYLALLSKSACGV